MVYVIITALVSLLVAIFALQNSLPVDVEFLVWAFPTSVGMIVLGAFVAGLFSAFCWGLKLKAQHYWQRKKLNEKLQHLEKDKENLELELTRLKKIVGPIKSESPKADFDVNKLMNSSM